MKKIFYIFLFSWILFFSSCNSDNNSEKLVTYKATFDTNMEVVVDSITTNDKGKFDKPQNPYVEGFDFIGWYYDEELTIPFNFNTKVNRDIKLYGKWEIKKLKVNLIYGDSVYDQYDYSYGDILTDISEPTLEGYDFQGLFYDQDFTQKYENSEIVLKEDLNFYIKFDIKKINISINIDTKDIESIVYDYGTKVSEISIPNKEHYDFDGWYYDDTFTGKLAYYQLLKNDCKLYGRFIPKEYEVSFYDNESLNSTISVEYGSKLSNVINVKKEGYHLVGLYFDKELLMKVNEEYYISNNINIYTKWEINQYEIELYVDGALYKSLNMSYNEPLISVTKPSKEHYDFSGWYKDEACSQSISDDLVVNSDIKLYGRFDIQKFDIFLYDESSIINKYSLEYGSLLSSILTPSKEGYTFINYYLDKELTILADLNEIVTASKYLYTKWIINIYQVELVIDNGLKDIVSKQYLETLTDYINPTKEGYLFSGWFKDESYTTSFSKDEPIKQDLTLFAKWTNINKVPYKVVYKLENISNSNYTTNKEETFYGKLSDIVSAPIINYDGFDVVDSDISGVVSFEEMLVLEVLYKRKTFDVTFYVNDTIYKVKKKVKYGSSFSIPSSWQIDDAILYGWYKENTFQTKVTKITNIKENTAVYAKIEPIIPGTSGLVYELNDDGASYSVTAYLGTDENVVIPNGYNHYPITKIVSLSCSDLIVSVTLSNHITSIGDYAFSEMRNLKTVIMNDTLVEIGDFAFVNCTSLEEFSINMKTNYIGVGAFYNCNQLEKITVDVNNHKYQSIDGVLYQLDNKELIIYPSNKKEESFEINELAVSIARCAIMNNSYIKKIIVGHSVTKINTENFNNCESLREIKLGSNVNYLDETIFDNLISLEKIEVDPNNMKFSSVDGVLYNKKQTIMIKYPTNKLGESFIIPQTVIMIKYHCFDACSNLHSLTLSCNTLYIEEEAFINLNELIIYTYEDVYLDTWHQDAFNGVYEIIYNTDYESVGDKDE